ncbi:phytolongin Phyl2.2-like isoform X2 [Andrographis paniculata]|nr:phytolongin Phyl2.2-like isoform X2 [Andrographis paniculata]XP_051143013.1 phytolongin Phyl2.2-like isoform X2 [Andrographis paniculata]XP_051143014.1 phytolongin Phyl2.2-like isoform X2 [Andrographis paniculata]XP_051143015.1 phytolongin Phyl2.2-like isoform X2 [Andrographis paniculata]XP_051143016.1 phytolongin Phyl2.2-like isoform X2 [Andrographis paniculata]XP_051143017.1 phytolongin Phyl2.2-like isoform X2 [Andrographis paniculata]
MISIPDFVHYVCIAKGTVVLAELKNSKDPTFGATAAKCLENTPPHHATFVHTVRSRSYTFLIDNSFVYFAIFDERLGKSEGLGFLKSVKDAFAEVFDADRNMDNFNPLCFQKDLSPVFRRLIGPASEQPRMDQTDVLPCGSGHFRERPRSSNGEGGINKISSRLPGELSIGRGNGENEGNGIELSHKFPVMLHRNGGLYSPDMAGHQRAKKVWKKQVWVVLSLDLMICVMLFGVWLWLCRGLECIRN